MQVDLYPSALNNRKFLAVPAKTNLKTWIPSGDFDQKLRRVLPLQNREDYQRGQVRVAVNVDQVMDDIERQGWALVEINVTIDIKR